MLPLRRCSSYWWEAGARRTMRVHIESSFARVRDIHERRTRPKNPTVSVAAEHAGDRASGRGAGAEGRGGHGGDRAGHLARRGAVIAAAADGELELLRSRAKREHDQPGAGDPGAGVGEDAGAGVLARGEPEPAAGVQVRRLLAAVAVL